MIATAMITSAILRLQSYVKLVLKGLFNSICFASDLRWPGFVNHSQNHEDECLQWQNQNVEDGPKAGSQTIVHRTAAGQSIRRSLRLRTGYRRDAKARDRGLVKTQHFKGRG